jgi:hypothetical protein
MQHWYSDLANQIRALFDGSLPRVTRLACIIWVSTVDYRLLYASLQIPGVEISNVNETTHLLSALRAKASSEKITRTHRKPIAMDAADVPATAYLRSLFSFPAAVECVIKKLPMAGKIHPVKPSTPL